MRFVALFIATPLFAAAGGEATIIDSSGNIWTTGATSFILTTPTAFQKTASSQVCATQTLSPFQPSAFIDCQHAYLTKQDPAGNISYATYLGGSSQDGGVALTSDAQGNIYLAGYTYSSDFPTTSGVVQTKNAGPVAPTVYTLLGAPFGPSWVLPGGDIFVAKFAADGTLLFSTLLGGAGEDLPTLIAVDSSGSIYIAGITLSQNFPVTANALAGQGVDNFFVRLNATGTVLTYSTYYVSPILAFDVDSQGRAYLTGGAGQPYVAVLDTVAGAVTSSEALPGLAGAGVAIALTPSQNLAVAISPTPPSYNFFSYPPQPARVLGDSYLVQFSSGGGIIAQTHFGQTQFDSILLDSAGNIYAFGHGTGSIPAAPIQLLPAPCTPTGGSFVIQQSSAGEVLASTYFRLGDDTAVTIRAPGQVLLYRAPSSATVTMDLTAQPAALFGCPQNVATGLLGAGLAPGEIFRLTGTGLGPAQGVGGVPDATGRFPTSLGGVQVLFGATPLPLLYVSADEIHTVAPFGFNSPATLHVENGTTAPPALDLYATSFNPGIFSVGSQGAIINQDGTVNTPTNPAPLGSIVSVYCTGTGFLENPVADGSIAPNPPPFDVTQLASPELTFAGMQGTTLWSGAAPGLIEGVTQINVQLPSSLPPETTFSAVPVILDASGVLSPAVNISVEQ